MRGLFRRTLSELQFVLRLQRDLREKDNNNRDFYSIVESKIIASSLLGQDVDIAQLMTPKDVQTLGLFCRDMRCLNYSIDKIEGILEREIEMLLELLVPSIHHRESLVHIRCLLVKESLTPTGTHQGEMFNG